MATLGASAIEAQTADPALRGHGGPVRALALDGNNQLASAGLDGAIIIWNASQSEALRVVRFHASAVDALASTKAGCFVSGGEDGRVASWCANPTDPMEVAAGHEGPVSALAIPADGNAVYSASWDRTVRVTSLQASGKPAIGRVLLEHGAPVTSIALSADGKAILSASFDGSVRLTMIETGVQLARLRLPGPVNGVVAANDGRFLLAGADGTLREVGRLLEPDREIELPDGPLTTVALSGDGRTIATAGMRTPVTLIDRASGRVRSQILGPGLPIWALAFSTDGRTLFTGGADRAVRRFDIATGQPSGVAIAPSGRADLPDPKSPGALVFRACKACHGVTAADTNLAGPTLAGIMGRRIGTAAGYDYSAPFRRLDIVWTPDTISRLFEVGPAAFTPGTKMPEQRITDPEDRKALVEWLVRVSQP